MRKQNHIFLALCLLLTSAIVFPESLFAQKKAKNPKKKATAITKSVGVSDGVGIGSGSLKLATVEREPYLGLEPCAKETPEQISELETATDKHKQVEILVERAGNSDEWIRACAVYRLGEFRQAARASLPLIIKLLRDEQNNQVWTHVETAMWKIPPAGNIPLETKLRNAVIGDVYDRLYAIFSLAYLKLSANSFQAKDVVKTLIETAKDEDKTVAWLSIMVLRDYAFEGTDISDAIPTLSELLKNGKLNPVNVVRVFVPMGANALPAAPLLLDVLYNPKKYAPEKENDSRYYSLYLTTAIALGKIGEPLLPILENEIEKEPFAILRVLSNLRADGTLPIIYKALKHKNPEVRKSAIENLPGLTSIGAVNTFPYLLDLVKDINSDVREQAMSKIGSIAQFTEDKSPELKQLLKQKAVPVLIERLKIEKDSCYAAMILGDIGEDAEAAIPALVKIVKPPTENHCAAIGLYDIGEKGRKFLTKEQIEEVKESKNYKFDTNYNKAKPIKPKEEPKPTPAVTDSDT
ncbi:MAG TPA: HEAT repeat domain-containing protein [Pyrinomonadaceae bacterium]|nr:HEAT repeat domain-containing protein [Pyrinomonadaceae bacterium]